MRLNGNASQSTWVLFYGASSHIGGNGLFEIRRLHVSRSMCRRPNRSGLDRAVPNIAVYRWEFAANQDFGLAARVGSYQLWQPMRGGFHMEWNDLERSGTLPHP